MKTSSKLRAEFREELWEILRQGEPVYLMYIRDMLDLLDDLETAIEANQALTNQILAMVNNVRPTPNP